jgi:hypothetical protein
MIEHLDDNDQWFIKGEHDLPSYPMGSLEHARAICDLARHNMSDMIPFISLPTWAVCKLLDALEEK